MILSGVFDSPFVRRVAASLRLLGIPSNIATGQSVALRRPC
jgi:glutathione S-transferase